jgi:hypothetical protein
MSAALKRCSAPTTTCQLTGASQQQVANAAAVLIGASSVLEQPHVLARVMLLPDQLVVLLQQTTAVLLQEGSQSHT